MLAEVFQIGFGLLAGRDVGEGDLHERPVVLVAGQDRKLQMKMYLVAVKRVIDDFALLKQLAVPQVDKLLAKVRLHIVTKNIAQPVQQRLLVERLEQRERVLIDVDHPDFAHAT